MILQYPGFGRQQKLLVRSCPFTFVAENVKYHLHSPQLGESLGGLSGPMSPVWVVPLLTAFLGDPLHTFSFINIVLRRGVLASADSRGGPEHREGGAGGTSLHPGEPGGEARGLSKYLGLCGCLACRWQ